MATSSTFARGYFRKLWRDAQASGKTLLAALETASDSAHAAVASGKTLQSTAGNGRSVTYEVNTDDATPTDLYELTARLLDLYDRAKADLGGSPSDSALAAKILTYLVGVRGFRPRFTTLER